MSQENSNNPQEERQVPLQDVVLSNSWALQAILQYLDELNPGARDRIWEHYQRMKSVVEEKKTDKPEGE